MTFISAAELWKKTMTEYYEVALQDSKIAELERRLVVAEAERDALRNPHRIEIAGYHETIAELEAKLTDANKVLLRFQRGEEIDSDYITHWDFVNLSLRDALNHILDAWDKRSNLALANNVEEARAALGKEKS